MERPIVTISEGKLRGITRESVLGKKYFSFTGIPYAQPPIGPLRFKRPQPPTKWSGLLDASKRTDTLATQYQTYGPKPWKVVGEENCLYLNVYANAIGRKRPVMFYVHGGGFVKGTGNLSTHGPDYFVTMDLVLVSVGYRLGPLGFLNLGHEVAPGNQGLRDILFALKWVQSNIEAFGGDPNNVTIFGNSSGSSICHLFTLIPAARGLFQKAILQSGTIFAWRNLLNRRRYENGYKIASYLGCESDDPKEIVEFLRTVSVKKLVSVEKHLSTNWEQVIMGQFDYGPVIDGTFCKDPVVPCQLHLVIENDSDIPIIIGNDMHEAFHNFAGLFNDVEHFSFYDEHINDILRNCLMMDNENDASNIVQEMKNFYLKGRPITPDTALHLIHLNSHTIINMTRKVVDLRNDHAKAPTYVYQFFHCGGEPTCYTGDQEPLEGVAHADEVSYMFLMKKDGGLEKDLKHGSVDRLVVERFIRMWYNFAATGNPTPRISWHISTLWKPSANKSLYFLDIGEGLTLQDSTKSQDWVIYEKFRKKYLGFN